MGRKRKRHQDAVSRGPEPARALVRKWLFRIGSLVSIVSAWAVGITIAASARQKPIAAQATQRVPVASQPAMQVRCLDDPLRMTPERLARVDIAEMNLLCASGLPEADDINVGRCLAQLDEWAARVKPITQRHLYRAHDARYAEHYKHSETWVRIEFLAQVLQEDCRVHYNKGRIHSIDFGNAKDLFIHGMIGDDNGGTCASMPVLYVAVGRRLGYPLKLVTTKGHVFVRWDDGKERFNVETTHGVTCYADEYYRNWPHPITDDEVKAMRYLVSLGPAEELAEFLASRGHCFADHKRWQQANDAYAAACRLAPDNMLYGLFLEEARTQAKWPTSVTTTRPAPEAYRSPYTDGLDDVGALYEQNRRAAEARERLALPSPAKPRLPQGTQAPPDVPEAFRPLIESRTR